MADPIEPAPAKKPLAPPAIADYVLCPTCSEEESKEVWYPQRAIRTSTATLFVRDGGRSCPLGHAIPQEGSAT